MKIEGPPLEWLLRRVGDVPPEFLAEPRIAGKGDVHVTAVVRDLFASRGALIELSELAIFAGRDVKADRNRLSIALLMTWLLADDALKSAFNKQRALALLRDDAPQLAAYTNAAKLVNDSERREELARLTLARLDLRPKGESLAQAQDRFTSISSLERSRVLAASQAAEARAREIREALARKAAQESADKWTRE